MSHWDKWGLVLLIISQQCGAVIMFYFLGPSRGWSIYWYSELRGWFRDWVGYAWLLRHLLGWVLVWLAFYLLALDLIWWRFGLLVILKWADIWFNMKFLRSNLLLLGETLLFFLTDWSLISEALALCRFHKIGGRWVCRHCWALKGVLSAFRRCDCTDFIKSQRSWWRENGRCFLDRGVYRAR